MITDDFSRPILLASRRMYSIGRTRGHTCTVVVPRLASHNSAFPCRPPPPQHFFPLLPSVLFTDQCPIFPPFRPRQKKGGRAELPSGEARHRLRRGLLLLLLLLLPYRPPLLHQIYDPPAPLTQSETPAEEGRTCIFKVSWPRFPAKSVSSTSSPDTPLPMYARLVYTYRRSSAPPLLPFFDSKGPPLLRCISLFPVSVVASTYT